MSGFRRNAARIGFIALAVAGFVSPAAPESDHGWTTERPLARRAPILDVAVPPIMESTIQDGASDPPPPGAPALLQAHGGVTALAGRVLQAEDGAPLVGVELRLGTKRVRTGLDGLFLIEDAPAGANVLTIDGQQARTIHDGSAIDHGIYEARVKVEPGRTTQLPWVSWLPKIDHSHDVVVPSVLDKEITVANPSVPDVALKLPAGAVVTGIDGEAVTRFSVTKINQKRPPFPTPRAVRFSVYATFQPGGATISGAHGEWIGGQIVYSNSPGLKPGKRTPLWAYDPDRTGWGLYGAGRVSEDGQRIEAEASARIYSLNGFFLAASTNQPYQNTPTPPYCTTPSTGSGPCGAGRSGASSDPVDLASGIFTQDQRDLYVDDVMPIEVRRQYAPDPTTRSFGSGMSLSYNMFFITAGICPPPGTLYLSDGSAIPFVQASPNTAADCGAVGGWVATAPGEFYNSTVIEDPATGMWVLTRPDGYKYYFGGFGDETLHAIQDPHGNRITILRDGNLNATQIVSPSGRHIYLKYKGTAFFYAQVASASDDLGHTVNYTYDIYNDLQTVVDVDGNKTSYGWANGLLTTVTYPNGGVLTNVYDANQRVTRQTQPDGGTWGFAYTLTPGWAPVVPGTLNAGGALTATSVTDPRGNVEKYTFNASGEILTDIKAYGTSLQSTYTYTLDPASQRPSAVLDPLGRTTAYTYDASGRPLTVKQLSGTANAVTTSYTYAWPSGQVATVTDPLGHTTTYARNAIGDLLSLTDPLGFVTSYTYDAQGHVHTATDPLSHTTTYTYNNGDLASVTDPLNRTTSYFTDILGRVTRVQNPAGGVAKIAYDALYGPTQTVDPNGHATTLAYGVTGALASVTDAKSGKVAYVYDKMDRLSAYTDALTHVATINSRDGLGEILKSTDRKGQVATYTYDALNRPATATYAGGSSVSYTFDLGGRLTKVVDSVGGTVTRAYDGLDRVTSETSAQGTVAYTYDAASRLTSLQAPSQGLINYGYDNDNRLTSITQGTASIAFGYDNASRRTTGTTPAGSWNYTYDAASQLTGINYVGWPGASLGTLTYSYGLDGSVTSRGGTLFASVLPAAVTSAAYDAGNRLTSRVTSAGTQTPGFDANGSLTSDGINSFTWDARNRMTAIGSQASFVYDAFGRRASVTQSAGVNAGTTAYLYSGDNVIQEQREGTISAGMLTGPGLDERYVRSNELVFTDLLGSTVALSNGSSIQTSYGYDPYGVTTSAGAATSNTYQFTGRENDGTTAGLMYYRARYYNPAWGRFVSEDPIGANGGLNLYGYVEQRPISLTDPSGKQLTDRHNFMNIPSPFEYDPRVNDKDHADLGHQFPYSFDYEIWMFGYFCACGLPHGNTGILYVQKCLDGALNGTPGRYEIGIDMNLLFGHDIVVHRSFRHN